MFGLCEQNELPLNKPACQGTNSRFEPIKIKLSKICFLRLISVGTPKSVSDFTSRSSGLNWAGREVVKSSLFLKAQKTAR
jgi:hypothetical protein